VTAITRPSRLGLALLTLVGLSISGCRRTPLPAEKALPPAYTRNQIVDPELRTLAEEIQKWAAQQAGTEGQPLYSRCEVLPVAQTVQPYGVGAYQQEPRLPVILTTGPGWAGLQPEEKEARAAQAFRTFSERLLVPKRQPLLRPTVTIQTPQGMELAWINHLDPSGKNLHGDED
jgi:hypothetical protein